MKLEIELTNSKLYRVTYTDGLDNFLQMVQFGEANSLLKTDDGNYIVVNKIVRFSVLE